MSTSGEKTHTPSEADVYAAAIKWCGEKERETFPEDIAYFRHNWSALPGLRRYVEAVVALATPAEGERT